MSDIKEYQKQFMQVEVIEPITSVWKTTETKPELCFNSDITIEQLIENENDTK